MSSKCGSLRAGKDLINKNWNLLTDGAAALNAVRGYFPYQQGEELRCIHDLYHVHLLSTLHSLHSVLLDWIQLGLETGKLIFLHKFILLLVLISLN